MNNRLTDRPSLGLPVLVLALWADDLPGEIKQDEHFKTAYVNRQGVLKEAASKRGRK